MNCPLCRSDDVRNFSRDNCRTYFQCGVCSLVFVPPAHYVTAEEEKKRYDLHRNSPDDPGYRGYLNRLFVPLSHGLSPGSRGLDFGSGPAPALSRMFREAGHSMALYDPFYEPDKSVFEQRYDFITASEVVEHLRDPKEELERLWQCLKPGGRLGIMTQFSVEQKAFSQWHYRNDPTHICFFSRPAFSRLSREWNADLVFPEDDVAIFCKRTEGPGSR
ncbi:MAG TPA: class I SAM-dependent methyltransferase [Nitrospirota bacterium]